jgi:glycosyltransferase involved in cell wall biosynthesis
MIHFITEPESNKWVLRRYCENFAKYLPATIGEKPDPTAEVNIFAPYYTYESVDTPTIAFFTHRQDDSGDVFDTVGRLADWSVQMCDKTTPHLPADRTTTIQVYPGEIFRKEKIVVGVAFKSCPSGRKRLDRLEMLYRIPGIEVKVANGLLPYEQMPSFYKAIDYLLVIADNEGGPMPVVEALAMGKPVIAPDVGFAWKYPVIRYSGDEELDKVLRGLVIPKDGWKQASDELLKVINLAKEHYGKTKSLS